MGPTNGIGNSEYKSTIQQFVTAPENDHHLKHHYETAIIEFSKNIITGKRNQARKYLLDEDVNNGNILLLTGTIENSN